MDSQRRYEVIFTALVAAFLLVAAEGRHAYGFYVALRLAATVGAVYWAVRVYHVGPRGWLWAFVAVAVLLNPSCPFGCTAQTGSPSTCGLGCYSSAGRAIGSSANVRSLRLTECCTLW